MLLVRKLKPAGEKCERLSLNVTCKTEGNLMRAEVPGEIMKMQKNQIYFCLLFFFRAANLFLNDMAFE